MPRSKRRRQDLSDGDISPVQMELFETMADLAIAQRHIWDLLDMPRETKAQIRMWDEAQEEKVRLMEKIAVLAASAYHMNLLGLADKPRD